VGDGLLLGVGRDADVRTGASKGAQVSLFDLTDIDDPRRVHLASLGQGEVLAEHESRAFTLPPDRATALLPMSGSVAPASPQSAVDTAGPRLSVSSAPGPAADRAGDAGGDVVAAVGFARAAAGRPRPTACGRSAWWPSTDRLRARCPYVAAWRRPSSSSRSKSTRSRSPTPTACTSRHAARPSSTSSSTTCPSATASSGRCASGPAC
jgi:hypothetical protein